MSDTRSAVVTRIAPSPTGSMHIGTARTALFNLLYARHCGGTFLLRIEDTDKERSTDANVQIILDGLAWLGLVPDAPPVFQAARADRHRLAVNDLLDRGRAYRCYMTVAELDAERERARAEGRAIRSPWRDRTPDDPGVPHVIRFKGPLDGETIIQDRAKGDVTFQNKELDDLVLLRTDGAPTYNLAVVVDDHEMGVTHVVRGDDHLNNAARQTLIYQALNWAVPVWCHLPLIHGPDGAKLSKRHGAQAVGEFREMGYLPEALRNYLARLGWGHGDDEIFTDAEAAEWFDIDDVVKAPARLDWPKLNFVNQQYIRVAGNERLAALVADVMEAQGFAPSPDGRAKLPAVIALVKEAAQTVVQLAELCAFALKTRPFALEDKIVGLLTEETRARLARLAGRLAEQNDWTQPTLVNFIRAFAESEGVGIGKFGQALRGVLSGGAAAPDLASTLAALGREEVIARLNDALSHRSEAL